MQLYSRKIHKTRLSVIGAMFVAVFLMVNGCKKPVDTTYETFDASNIRVVNGLPDRTDVKFYLDSFNLTLNQTWDYGTSSWYYVVRSGPRRSKFYSTSTEDTFAVKDIQLEAKKNYSLFLAGNAATPKYFLTEDDLISPPPDKSKIRLANLALTSVNVDLAIQKLDIVNTQPEVTVLTNVAPESITDYVLVTVPVSKGNFVSQYYNVRIYKTGTTDLVAEALSIELTGTTINTIIANGIDGGSPAITIRVSRDWLDW